MSFAENKAVFLSYASQDAAAAQRICEALRAAGVEVWFDAEGGLEHGDAWDAKIRRQIKECVLFLPIISANTQAREEGYFRIEWDLAAERARGIASGVAFILPVVIDGTKEPDALVPDRFRTVQWTKLSGGNVPPEVLQRFLKLWSHRTGALKHKQAAEAAGSTPATIAGSAVGAPGWRIYAAMAAAIFVLVAALGWWLLRGSPAPATPAVAAPAPPKPAVHPRYASSRPDIGTLLTRVIQLTDKADVSRAELETALTFVEQASRLDPSDATIWAEWAIIERRYVVENLDSSAARIDSARQHAKQAVALDARNPHARLADALTLLHTNRDRAGREAAAALLEGLVAEGSDRVDVYLALSRLKFGLAGVKEALAVLDRAAHVPGAAGRVAFQRAIIHTYNGDWGEANRLLDDALALERSAEALQWKSYLSTIVLGDAATGQRLLNEIPPAMLTEDFPASAKMFVALWARDFATVVESMRAVSRDYIGSGALSGPTGYYIGYALARQGKKSAAEIEWRSALEVVNTRLKAEARDRTLLTMKTLLLHALGEREEVARVLAALRELHPNYLTRSWEGHILASQVLPPEEAVEVIRTSAALGLASGLYHSLRLDPFVDKIRDHPKFRELLAEVEKNPKLDPAAAAQPRAARVAPDDKSIAVLPFANLSEDKANEYFSDGISEELLNVLAKVPGLKVSARTSAFYFKGKEVPIPEIAKQLGVAYVVEGSVRKAGDKVRITAQLIKAADGFHVWSDTFTRDLKDIFAVQDEIAELIAQSLKLKLALTPERSQTSPEAYGLLLQGRFFARQEGNAGRKQSLEYFRRALALEPDYALAWAELAQSYIRLARFGGLTTAEGMKEARLAAHKSLALDPDQPTALEAMAWVQRTADWDWRAAQKSIQRALGLAPGNSSILTSAAIFYHNVGRGDEALALARQAVERDPLNAMAQINLGDLLMQSGHVSESIGFLTRGIALAPQVEEFRSHLAIALTQIQRFTEAEAVVEQEPNEAYRLWGRGIMAGLQGNRAAVRQAREALLAKHDPSMTGYVAMLFAAEGQSDQAFEWLERSIIERDSSVCWIKTSTYYDVLKSDPRWPVLLRKLGLADDQLQ
jgi:TolB-like protein/Tfp pilus assembly protein PilF